MNNKQLQARLSEIKSNISEYLIPNDNEVYLKTITEMIKPFKKNKINKVVAIDMKGLMYGPIVANKLKVPFVPVLKGGKIPRRDKVIENSFVDYSKKTKSIELFKSSVTTKDRILIVDDWFDSGNTGKALIKLIEQLGGKVVGISVIFNQLKPEDERVFEKYNCHFLVRLKPKENLN